MKEELQKKLFEKYPKIFGQKDLPMTQTAMCWGISCGDGWYDIIDTLCAHLQNIVDKPYEEIEIYQRLINQEKEKNALQKEMSKDLILSSEETIAKYQEYIESWKKKIIPQLEAVQVKEKFGGLRFYLSGYPIQPEIDAKVSAYINFAESLSYKVCSECGNKSDPDEEERGWIYTLCKSCKNTK